LRAWKLPIQISEVDDKYLLSVPESQVILKFPKGNFLRAYPRIGGATANPRYFFFEDKKAGIIVSGWFEPEKLYPGIQQLWEQDTKAYARSGLSSPQNVSFEKQGIWDLIFFSRVGLPNMRANCVLAGTWIDLHISLYPSSTDDRARLIEFLKSVEVERGQIKRELERMEAGPDLFIEFIHS